MGLQVEQIRETLRATSAEFRRLEEEHAQYVEMLEKCERSTLPAQQKHAEIARLKKLKLWTKDRIEELIRDYRREQAETVQAT